MYLFAHLYCLIPQLQGLNLFGSLLYPRYLEQILALSKYLLTKLRNYAELYFIGDLKDLMIILIVHKLHLRIYWPHMTPL